MKNKKLVLLQEANYLVNCIFSRWASAVDSKESARIYTCLLKARDRSARRLMAWQKVKRIK